MKNRVLLFVVCLSAYFQHATTEVETVWLKDVTTRLQTDKRTLSDSDLPDQLSFQLKSKLHALTLNLKRNHRIDPNVDIYTVNNLNDGRSFLEKAHHLEKEDVAYYQDIENGAFMTARCVRRSNGQCERQINGIIRIGDRIYDLEPTETDVKSRDFMEITGLVGKRYHLKDQGNIEMEMPVENKDRIRNVAHYYIEVVVVTDSSIYGLFLAMATSPNPTEKDREARKKIRAYFLHVMNGVDMRYRGIDHPGIVISVIVRAIVILQTTQEFKHEVSSVEELAGIKLIQADNYLNDLKQGDIRIQKSGIPAYDQVILFTKYMLYGGGAGRRNILNGNSVTGGICEIGKRVQICRVGDFFETVTIAAHELGHALGAEHDGSHGATSCSAKDDYIMTPQVPVFEPTKPHSRNPWLFSKCSVKAFVKTLHMKTCLKGKGVYSQDDIHEWHRIQSNQPGELFNLNEQCHIINGPGSTYCGRVPGMICKFMYCTNPETGNCIEKYLSAATGTNCGGNNWCKEGLCVPKDS